MLLLISNSEEIEMSAIRKPPKLVTDPFRKAVEKDVDSFGEYLAFHSPVDEKGRYLHFDELFRRIPSSLDVDLVWTIVKSARNRQLINLSGDEAPLSASFQDIELPFKYLLTPNIQKVISKTDRHTNTAVLEWMLDQVGEKDKLEYLLKDLIEDEAISSSQLEGAATRTKTAKEMLKRERAPRTPDEKMILGNFRMMKYVWNNKHKDLSIDFLEELHKVGVEGIDDDKYKPGFFRTTNDVVVVDEDGNTVHTPPLAEELVVRINRLINFANRNQHEADCKDYIHPLLKAISLHFLMGYEHVFHDGNGRVARALFYWYLFKTDFSAFRYISISVLLKAAPVQYGKSYLKTETDDLDLTYFFEYQCSIVLRAINEFKNAHSKAVKDIEDFDMFLIKSGLYNKMKERQRVIFQVAKNGVEDCFTINLVSQNLSCSYNTAATALNGLVKLELFSKEKKGKEWEYKLRSKDELVNDWRGT